MFKGQDWAIIEEMYSKTWLAFLMRV
jgi:hypothetical protein